MLLPETKLNSSYGSGIVLDDVNKNMFKIRSLPQRPTLLWKGRCQGDDHNNN